MDNLKGKKLLILGGGLLSCDIVRYAKNLGVYTIVTDWYDVKRSPAKLIADEYWNEEVFRPDKLAVLVKENRVDGVITGFTDSYLLQYQKLCELADLPCYATKEQFEASLDKKTFKRLCRENGVGTVPQFDISTFDKSIISDRNQIIIKPVDNSGSRGINICSNPEDFDYLLAQSMSFSEKKEVLLEKYMTCDDVSFEYKIQEGEITLSSICDRYIHQTEGVGSVTSGLMYPSKYLNRYLREEDLKVKQMFTSMGLKNGVLFMQAFVDEDDFFFYEMGYRLSGGRHFIFTDNQNGDNAVKELVSFALTGHMNSERLADVCNPMFSQKCCQLSVLCRSGRIAFIRGRDALLPISEIIDTLFSYGEGDTVGKEGTSAQIVARFHIVADTKDRIKEVISIIQKTLQILDDDGNNMIINIAFIDAI